MSQTTMGTNTTIDADEPAAHTLDIPLNAPVECVDGPCGHSRAVLLNPVNNQITHMILRESGVFGSDRKVPLEFVTEGTPLRIRLGCTKAQLADMPPFVATEYLPGPTAWGQYSGGGILLWPYVTLNPGMDGTPINHEQIPFGELVIHRGSRVQATDGHIGQVDELVVNAGNDGITHIVLREGHFWNQREIAIPIGQIARIDEDTVYLTLSKQQIADLPTVPVHRPMQ